MKKNQIPDCKLEDKKLSKKQLTTKTYIFGGPNNSQLTIGELSLDQLRVIAYYAEQDWKRIKKLAYVAYNAIEGILP